MFKKNLILFFSLAFMQLCYAQSPTNLNQAMYYYDTGEYQRAKELFERLYQDEKYQDVVYDDYINTLIKLRAFADAEKIIKKRIKEAQTPGLDKQQLGLLYKAQNRISDAQKIFNDLLRNLPADAFSISQIASNFYSDGDLQMALSTFLNGRLVLKDENQFRFELINLYRFLKNKEGLLVEVLGILETRPDYMPTARSILSGTLESDTDYQLLKTALLRQIQKSPQNISFAELLAWTLVQLKDYPIALTQTIALDKRTNDNGSRVFALCGLLMNNKAWDEAQRGYNYLIGKGTDNPYYIPAKVQLLKAKQLQTEMEPGSADFETMAQNYQQLIDDLGKNARTLFAIKELALIKAKQLNQYDEAQQLLEEAMQFTGLRLEDQAEIKLELADIYLLNSNPWDAELVLSQVEKSLPNHPLAQEAKLKNAKISFFNGDFDWAKSQLDVLKASTSQLIANDALDLSLLIRDNMQRDTAGVALKAYARAEFLRELKKNDDALKILDSITVTFPQTELADEILLSKAKIFIAQRNAADALKTYQELYTNYPESIWADDALFYSAEIYEKNLKQKDQARQLYQRLITDYSGSFYMEEARKNFRRLRGDDI